jgi:5-methylcytosine-specific restriction endonuclease McrA
MSTKGTPTNSPEVSRELRELFASWEKKPHTEKRRYIPARIRRQVFERDGMACVNCGSTEHLSLDHIKPFSKGGAHTPRNLRVFCRSCNSRKSARDDHFWRKQ